MTLITRRTVLRNALAVAATGPLARPFIANAAASTATVWWTQGFVPEEDTAFKRIVDEYQKQSGNTIDFSIIPFAPLNQKVVSAFTTGDVPDLIDINVDVLVPQNVWDDKLVDVGDVVDTQKAGFHPTLYTATQYYNNVSKKRGTYIIPYKTAVVPFHVWNSLVEKAGFKLSDAPKTWDAFWDFFKPMQAKLRETSRNIYALGLQCTSTGPNDGNNLFNHFLIANGGNDIVTKDGKPHLDDPIIKEAVIKSLTSITKTYNDGYVPSGALSWNDADDNNAFHSKLFVMDFDGTISTEVAIKDLAERAEVTTLGLPNDNSGKPMPAQLGVAAAVIPKGAKAIPVAKEFMTYLIKPDIANGFLKEGLGRWLPAMPSIVKNDSFWTAGDPQVQAYVKEGVLGEIVPNYPVLNPGWAEVNAQQVWGAAEADIIRNGTDPKVAAEAALKKVEAILAKYPIVS
ncbi:MAG TPA: ABC transporter substrate-binding protein [Stellaceae bacterium]|nr:ABC transporter substrate-binding protein [Stellaceae bacterium]